MTPLTLQTWHNSRLSCFKAKKVPLSPHPHTHTHTHTHPRPRNHAPTSTRTYTHTHLNTNTLPHARTHSRTRAFVSAYKRTCTHALASLYFAPSAPLIWFKNSSSLLSKKHSWQHTHTPASTHRTIHSQKPSLAHLTRQSDARSIPQMPLSFRAEEFGSIDSYDWQRSGLHERI